MVKLYLIQGKHCYYFIQKTS